LYTSILESKKIY